MRAGLQRKCACGGTPGPTGECAECRKKRLERKEVAPAPSVVPPAALPSPLGHDFGRMRVHARLQRKPADREAPSSCGLFDVRMVTIPSGLRGIISFRPDPGTCPTCASIRLVQIVRVFEKPGEPYIWSDFERGRENVKTRENTRKGIKGGYFVDHLSMQCSQGAGCGIYYRDHFPHATKSHDGSNDGTTAITASLWDEPTGNADDIYEFETCAHCQDTGDFLGCVDWGFTNDAAGQATASPALEHDAPSATFMAALKTFDRYYRNRRR